MSAPENPPRPINAIGVTLSLQNGLNIELGAADEKPLREQSVFLARAVAAHTIVRRRPLWRRHTLNHDRGLVRLAKRSRTFRRSMTIVVLSDVAKRSRIVEYSPRALLRVTAAAPESVLRSMRRPPGRTTNREITRKCRSFLPSAATARPSTTKALPTGKRFGKRPSSWRADKGMTPLSAWELIVETLPVPQRFQKFGDGRTNVVDCCAYLARLASHGERDHPDF
jgi:hypothetical protein